MTSIREVVRPRGLEDVLSILADHDTESRLLAGGTDLLLKYRDQPGSEITIVDTTGVATLGEMTEEADGLRIGAAVRLADIIASDIVADRFPVLVDGAAVVAGPQIRNMATVGGNVCNASPSADTIPPLLVLNARAHIVSAAGRRIVPVEEFFVGPGKTILERGEMLEALWVPWPEPNAAASYTKLSPRRAMDLAVVGVAVALWGNSTGLHARIGLGAVAPTPIRATAAEEIINGAARMDPNLAADAARAAAAGISPISDVRGSAEYRKKMVERLVTRLLVDLGERVGEQQEA
ncbi:MAG: xanthine dehydrogenase family protein subunit M [Acidimicrobiia bacterium]|nr:xanthine dehydrogenase family protein subunit M [Acidimicrobiia bacterium]